MTVENPPSLAAIPYAVPRRVRWGLTEVGIAVAAFITVLGVASGIGGGPDSEFTGFVLGLIGYAVIAVVVVIASLWRGQRSLTRDFGLALRSVDLAIGIAWGLALRIATIALTLGLSAVTGHSPDSGNYTVPTTTLWLVLSGVVLASLVGPFVEELFVRGLVLQSVRNLVLRWRRREQPAEPAQQRRAMWISVVVSAVFFTLLHSGQSTDALVVTVLTLATLALGVGNALLVYRTGRLGAGIVAHVVYNGSAIALAVLLPNL